MYISCTSVTITAENVCCCEYLKISCVHLALIYKAGSDHAYVFSPLRPAVLHSLRIAPHCARHLFIQHFFFWHYFPLSDHGWCCWMQNHHCFPARGLSQQQHTAKHRMHPANNSNSPYSATLPALLMLLIRNELGN